MAQSKWFLVFCPHPENPDRKISPNEVGGLVAALSNQIHHVAIICSNYEKSKIFYSEILGFPVLRETFRASRGSYKLDLQVNASVQIELFSFPNPPPRTSRPEACGLRHLAFAVANLTAAIDHLHFHGVSTEEIRIDEFTQKKFTFFTDPDGLPLELYEL